ncbi:MAG: PAS domain S-box protein, partial [Prochlorothrix sp.]
PANVWGADRREINALPLSILSTVFQTQTALHRRGPALAVDFPPDSDRPAADPRPTQVDCYPLGVGVSGGGVLYCEFWGKAGDSGDSESTGDIRDSGNAANTGDIRHSENAGDIGNSGGGGENLALAAGFDHSDAPSVTSASFNLLLQQIQLGLQALQLNQQVTAQYQNWPVPTYTWRCIGDDFELIAANRAAAELTQQQVFSHFGARFSVLYRDWPDLIEAMWTCFRERRNLKREIFYPFRSLKMSKWLRVTYSYLAPDLVWVYAEDIDSEKRMGLELQAANSALERQIPDRTTRFDPDTVGLATTLQLTQVGSWICYPNGEYLWSETLYQILSISNQDPHAYATWRSRVNSKDWEQYERIKAEYATKASIDPYTLEYRYYLPDCLPEWHLLKGHYVYDPETQAVAYSLGVILDITDRKQAELAFARSHQELATFKSALDQAAIVAITDTQGKIIYVKQKFCQISGYSDRELLGKTHRVINSGYHPRAFFQQLWRTISQGKTWRGEICNRAKTGDLYWVDTTIVPFIDETGKVFQYLSIRFEITETHNNREQLQRLNLDLEQQITNRTQQLVCQVSLRQQILETMSDGLCVYQTMDYYPYVYFTLWNSRMESITGYSIETINRLGWHQSLYPDPMNRQRAIDQLARTDQGETLQEEEWRITRADGQQRWICISTSLLQRNEEAPQTLAVIQDITKRKIAAEELQESESRFRQLAESINQVFWLLDPETYEFLYVSPAYAQIWQQLPSPSSRETPLWLQTVHPDDRRLVTQMLQQSIKTGYDQEYRIINAKGAIRWVRDRTFPITNAAGEIYRLAGVTEDITEQKQAEEELQTLAALVENSTDFIALINLEGRLLYLNPGGYALLGRTMDPANHPLHFGQCLSSASQRHLITELLPTLQTVQTWQGELELWHRETAQPIPSVAKVFTIYQPVTHQPLCYATVIRDIRDRKRAEEVLQSLNAELEERIIQRTEQLQRAKEAAEAANQSKSAFLANMSHELRTPLNAILGYAQLLVKNPDLSAKQVRQLTAINNSGEHLLGLINNILDMSKIEAGYVSLSPKIFDLGQFISSLVIMVDEPARTNQVQFYCETDDRLPQWVRTDEGKLRQVLLNLINNAIKFSPQGSVTLRVFEDSDPNLFSGSHQDHFLYLTFQVIDTGCGIAPEYLPHIFDPFVQATEARSVHQGTGLGLSICKSFCDMLGGSLTCRSTVGEGTTFQFQMPLEILQDEDQGLDVGFKNLVAVHFPAQPARILIAEDQVSNQVLIQEVLESHGFGVRLVEDGMAAIEEWWQWQPDLILMDLRMPRLDGLGATCRIRAARSNPNAPPQPRIIAVTASAFETDRTALLAAGCDDFLAKPLSLSLLFQCFQTHLNIQCEWAACDRQHTETSPPPFPPIVPPSTLPPEAQAQLHTLPRDFLQALHNSATLADDQALRDLLTQIPRDYTLLIQMLQHIIEDFNFHILVDWLQDLPAER